MGYLDFDLHIGEGSGADFPASVVKSPVGEARGTLRFPFDAAALASQLQGLELAVLKSGTLRRDVVMVTPEKDPVVGFGQRLFEALFADHIEVAFRRSQDRARSEGKGLRVRLRVDAPELSALPWEFLYDSSAGDYVCLRWTRRSCATWSSIVRRKR